MNRTNNFIELFCVSGIISIISKFLGGIKLSYMILLLLLMFDTITGMIAAIKYKRFNSKGLSKFIKKTLSYTLSIIVVRLLEIGMVALYETMMLSQLMVAFLEVIETISILENLALIGVPIPSNFIPFLINHLKIPGLEKALRLERDIEKDIVEIQEIRKYHLQTFKEGKLKRLLEIKFNAWECLAIEISRLFTKKDRYNNELIYYKVMAVIELCFKDVRQKLMEECISKRCIKTFDKLNQAKVVKWLQTVEEICFLNQPIEIKKQKLIDGIIVVLYQIIIDARKQSGLESAISSEDQPLE